MSFPVRRSERIASRDAYYIQNAYFNESHPAIEYYRQKRGLTYDDQREELIEDYEQQLSCIFSVFIICLCFTYFIVIMNDQLVPNN
jgi:hypothetical protein